MLNRSALGWAAASAGICFIGYCIYFDRKRRNDPLFKQRLRDRRRKVKQNQSSNVSVELPDMADSEAMQRFFLKEIQLGEELLGQGQIEEAVEHLSLAVGVCGQSEQLLAVLEQTLPPQVYALLKMKAPIVAQRIAMKAAGIAGMPMGMTRGGPTVTPLEDDLE